MNYDEMSLEELLSIENKNGKVCIAIGHKYYNLKEYDSALEYYKRAETFEDSIDSAVAVIIDIYYKAFDKTITLKDNENLSNKVYEYMKKFNECYWDEKYLSKFDLYKGLYDFSKDKLYFKGSEAQLNVSRYLFLCSVIFYGEKKDDPSIDDIVKDEYCNTYLMAGWCYEIGFRFKKDERKAKEYYKKAHDLKMIYATLRLGIICSHLKEHDESYKYIYDAATGYKGKSYNYTVTDSLIKELKNTEFGLSGAKLILARMLEFEFEDYTMCNCVII